MHRWDIRQLVETATGGMRAAESRRVHEQAVHGIESLDELALHDVLAEAFASAQFGVEREWPYPGDVMRRPTRAQRERCDLVLTGHVGETIIDPVVVAKERDAAAGTLFADAAWSAPRPAGCDPGDAFWLEVKTLGQFAYASGVPGPNPGYGSELTRALREDLSKLAREPMLRHAASLLVLFTADEETALHDTTVALHRCVDQGIAFGSPVSASFPIADRIGNRCCSVFLTPAQAGPG